MAMEIVIPTKGRTNSQYTIKSFLGSSLMKRVTLVCPAKEAKFLGGLRTDWKVEAQPDPNWKIHEKRAWILQEWGRRGHDKIVMLDDDLRFAIRANNHTWQLRELRGEELAGEFDRLEEKLSPEFPHVSFSQRQGNNQIEQLGWKVPSKMCYVLAYHLPTVLEKCVLGRIHLREDMELSLQLILQGYPNAIWTESTVDQRGYDKPGGANDERTVHLSNEEARKLERMYPAYVSTVERAYKASLPRIEVMVQWKKALEDGLRNRKAAEQTA